MGRAKDFAPRCYRKKPVVIQAVRLDGSVPWRNVANWCDGSIVKDGNSYDHILIRTLEGNMRAEPGDWIICGVEGEFYPCKDNIFRATYEDILP